MSNSGARLAMGFILVGAAVAVRLAFWQLDRHHERKAANEVLLAARQAPAIDLGSDDPAAGRMATGRGRFERDGELLLRNRVHNQAPGVHVVTPFRVEGADRVIWVLRGFAHASDGIRPGEVPPPVPGVVTVLGELQPLPVTENDGQPTVVDGDTTWRRLDAGMAKRRRPEAPPLVMYLSGGVSGPGALPAVEPPVLDNGPHFSYVIQWLAIATALLAFGWWFVRKPAGREPSPPVQSP